MVDPELVEILFNWKEELNAKLDSFKNEFYAKLDSFKDEFNAKLDSFKDEMYAFRNEMYTFKDEMYSFRNEMYAFKDEMYTFKNETQGAIDSLRYDIYKINNKLIFMEQRLTSVENICTVMQEEHGKKLDLLLEYTTTNIKQHEDYDKSFQKVNNKLFEHDAKFSIIEGSDIYQKMIKGKSKSNLGKTSLV